MSERICSLIAVLNTVLYAWEGSGDGTAHEANGGELGWAVHVYVHVCVHVHVHVHVHVYVTAHEANGGELGWAVHVYVWV